MTSVVGAFPTARPYQRKGIEWLYRKLSDPDIRAVLLCDDAGLGKTLQALGAASRLGAERVLVIAPAGARRVWRDEIARWLPHWSSRVFLVEPGTSANKVLLRLSLPDPLVMVVGYDELSRNMDQRLPNALGRVEWDLLILDEAHYLKNPSNRTAAVYGSAASVRHHNGIEAVCRKVLLLTGTPTPNHAGELYQHCRVFWPFACSLPRKGRTPDQPPTRVMNQAEFEDRYTLYKDTVFGRQVFGSKNQVQLRDALHDVVLRRHKDQVLPELPPLVTQDVALTPVPNWQDQLGAHERSLARRLSYDDGRAVPDDDAFIATLRAATMSGGTHVASLRRQLGEMKVLPVVEWITERMASIQKLLVFAWHVSTIEHLRRRLEQFDPVVITGATTPNGRTAAIDLFQHRDRVRIFIGQILACGTAITLTAAHEVAIAEPSWVPGENLQAICRAHRLGQHDSVLASFLYLPGTLDERIMRTFRRKAAEISQLQEPAHDEHQHQPERSHASIG